MISRWFTRRATPSCCPTSAAGRTLPGGVIRSRYVEERAPQALRIKRSIRPTWRAAITAPRATWPYSRLLPCSTARRVLTHLQRLLAQLRVIRARLRNALLQRHSRLGSCSGIGTWLLCVQRRFGGAGVLGRRRVTGRGARLSGCNSLRRDDVPCEQDNQSESSGCSIHDGPPLPVERCVDAVRE